MKRPTHRPSIRRRREKDIQCRPPFARMARLHEKLQRGLYPNCRRVAAELEVSPKTIQRDIDFMRDRLGLPIEYDQLHFGFYYTQTVTHFPTIEVSEGELVALFVAQKALAQYQNTPFAKPLETAFRKIGEGLRDRITFSWTDLDDSVSFRSVGRNVADLEVFEAVSSAILASRETRFQYCKLGTSAWESRHVQPYHLGCIDNQWYLFGLDNARGQIRTFALSRMRGVTVLNTRFRRPANFDVGQLLKGSFGVFEGKEKHAVRIRFDAFAGRLVRERQWHESQEIRPLPDGGVELALTLGSLVEIERWVLSWGSHAEVLAPDALRAQIARSAREILVRHERRQSNSRRERTGTVSASGREAQQGRSAAASTRP